MPRKKRFVRVTISLDAHDYADLGTLADETDVSRSWVIRQAIRELADKYRDSGRPELALTFAHKKDK